MQKETVILSNNFMYAKMCKTNLSLLCNIFHKKHTYEANSDSHKAFCSQQKISIQAASRILLVHHI